MTNYSSLILSVSGPGGLFDFDATLPLVAIQFLILTGILNILLYNPLLNIIKDRNNSILDNLSAASTTLEKAEEITYQYEVELNRVRKASQLEIANSQKIHKEILDSEINILQKSIDDLLCKIMDSFIFKKENVIDNLNNEVNSLTIQIKKKLSI